MSAPSPRQPVIITMAFPSCLLTESRVATVAPVGSMCAIFPVR
jgi:hypothetical protein